MNDGQTKTLKRHASNHCVAVWSRFINNILSITKFIALDRHLADGDDSYDNFGYQMSLKLTSDNFQLMRNLPQFFFDSEVPITVHSNTSGQLKTHE